MGRADVIGAYRMLAEAFRQDVKVPDTWAARLAGEDGDAVLEAAERLIERSEWMPNLGQFVQELKAGKHQQAVKSSRGWVVKRHCGRCVGSGWVEVEQQGSHLAVIACPNCDGTGTGNDLPSRVTPPDEARERLAELRRVLAVNPIVKQVP